MQKMIFLAALILILLLTSCSSSEGHRRGSLKDAMRKSSDSYQGERKIEPASNYNDTTYYNKAGFRRISFVEDDDNCINIDTSKSITFKDGNFSLGLSSGVGYANFDGRRRINSYRISGDVYSKSDETKDMIAQFILGSSSIFVEYDKDSTNIGNSVDGTMNIIYGGFALKRYFTSANTFFDFYLSGGINFSYLMWDYRNKFEVDNHKISDDGVAGGDLNFNAGVNLLKTEWFKLGTELNTGIYLWGDETNEEFTNDLFRASPYARLSLVLSFDKR